MLDPFPEKPFQVVCVYKPFTDLLHLMRAIWRSKAHPSNPPTMEGKGSSSVRSDALKNEMTQ